MLFRSYLESMTGKRGRGHTSGEYEMVPWRLPRRRERRGKERKGKEKRGEVGKGEERESRREGRKEKRREEGRGEEEGGEQEGIMVGWEMCVNVVVNKI